MMVQPKQSRNGNCERCGMEGTLWLIEQPLEDIAVIEDAVWYKEEEEETASEIASNETVSELEQLRARIRVLEGAK